MSKIWLSRLAQIQTTIRGFKAGNVFYLRDCISCPQALWGDGSARWLTGAPFPALCTMARTRMA